MTQNFTLRPIGDTHNFFGYYNKSNFSHDNRYLIGNRVDMFTGDLTGTEVAEVGYYDLQDNNQFYKVGETTTWNWQMGCQSQWVGDTDRIIFNTRATQKSTHVYPDFQSTIVDITSGESRNLPLPIYVMAPDGTFALTVNYSRFMVTHRTIGYNATVQEPTLDLAPKNDGIYNMDIATGDFTLVLSLDDLRNFHPVPSMDKAIHWVTHMEINPSGTRCLFIHRWTERVLDETCFLHRLFTMNPDGTNLRLLECSDHPLPQLADTFDIDGVGTFDYEKSEYQISHPMWKSDTEVIVWGPHAGEIHYHLYDDMNGSVQVIGRGILDENGHMTYSNNGRWLLTDTYPDANTDERILFMFDCKNQKRIDMASLYTPADLGKHNRCDLHPRWSRDNTMICIDSVHEGMRKMYIMEVDFE